MARRRFTKKKNKELENAGKIPHKKTTVDGIVFHSEMESNYYLKLKEDKENGLIKDFTLQPEYILQDKYIIVDGQVIEGSNPDFNKIKRKTKAKTISAIKYIADFLITDLDNSIRVVDTKGKSTPEFELKKRMFMFKYPHLSLEVLIYNKKTKSWDDFYEYQAELRAKKRAAKLAETN